MKSSGVNCSLEGWWASPAHPGWRSEQSILKSPCEASDRTNQLTRSWIQEGRMSDRDMQAKEGLSAGKVDSM